MSFRHHLMSATHTWLEPSIDGPYRIALHQQERPSPCQAQTQPKICICRRCIVVAHGSYTFNAVFVCSRKCKSDKFFNAIVYGRLCWLFGHIHIASCVHRVMMTTALLLTMPLFVADADSDSVDISMYRQDNVCSSMEPDEVCEMLEFRISSLHQSLISCCLHDGKMRQHKYGEM